jgi:hypothetical protein
MSTAAVSIVYITHRREPRFEWFADSLAHQLGPDDPDVIVVDGLHSPERGREFELIVGGRFAMRHVAPKPTPYSGKHRVTTREYSAIANARNTGIICSRAAYVVFIDDSGVLADGWWQEVCRAAEHGYVVAGAYENRHDLVVVDGRIHGGRRSQDAPDARWELGDDDALVQIAGSQAFGCGLGVPRERLSLLNGFDELCDPIGGEDANLGIRLAWSGARLFFSRRMLSVKDALRHRDDVAVRLDRGHAADTPLDEARYMSCLSEFGVGRRTLEGRPWDCGHLCLDILYGTRSLRSLGNRHDILSLTERDLPDAYDDLPTRYWATGEALAEL